MKKNLLIAFGITFISLVAFLNINLNGITSEVSETSINSLCKANVAQAECSQWICANVYTSCCWSPYNASIYF